MGTDLIINANFCSFCGQPLRHGHRFCPQCGTAMASETPDSSLPVAMPAVNSGAVTRSISTLTDESSSSQAVISIAPSLVPILNNRWIVIGLLAAVGPIGLPALWFSPRFKPWVKLTISIIYFALTAIVPLAIAWYWLDFALRPLVNVF